MLERVLSELCRSDGDLRLELLVHLFQTAPIRLSHFDEVLSSINKLATLRVPDEALLCQFPQEYF